MKYSILINQKLAIDNKLNLDILDLAIFEYIKDFSHTKDIQKIVENEKVYYWISYQKIIDDIPILGINTKDAIYRRIKKLMEEGILEENANNSKLGRSYFCFGPKYDTLVFKTDPSDEKSDPLGGKTVPPSDEKSDDNIINNKTITIYSPKGEQENGIVEYGNKDITKTLAYISKVVGCSTFKESQQMQRRYGKHLFELGKKIGIEEFNFRLKTILEDQFKAKNCNKLAYLYGELKSFIHSPVVPEKQKEVKSYSY